MWPCCSVNRITTTLNATYLIAAIQSGMSDQPGNIVEKMQGKCKENARKMQGKCKDFFYFRINRFTCNKIPVMAAVAVRKKVVSIGHFSPCFYLQSLNFFYLLDQIKSNCMY